MLGGPRASLPVLNGAVALLALTAVCFIPVRPTNFRGYDEWVIVSLLSRGILDFPYANRPLALLWALPAWAIAPDRLWGFLVVHAAWIGLGGVAAFLLARRLLRAPSSFAFLVGAFSILWAPSDDTRLCSVQLTIYSGCTFAVLLALWLLVEGWSRRAPTLAVMGAAAGFAAVLSVETALAPLALGPLLLLLAGGGLEPRRLAAWVTSFLALFLAAGLRAVAPRWNDPERLAYQTEFQTLDPSPLRVAQGTLEQLWDHLAPLADLPAIRRTVPLAAVAVVVFAVGLFASTRRGRETLDVQREAGAAPRAALVAASVGLLWALASYLPFVLSTRTRGPNRTQFLSTPGVAVLMAAVVIWLASLLPRRARLPAAGLLGAWVVAVGTGRVAGLQVEWDAKSAYPKQGRALLELTALAPDVAPGTLIVLLPHGNTWPFDFSFRHAVDYLYEGRAVGHAVRAQQLLYKVAFEAGGVRSEPVPVLRGPWRERAFLFGYDALVVLREKREGHLELLEAWPEDDLPTLPTGASYFPHARIRSGPRPRRLAILDPSPMGAGAAANTRSGR